MGVGRYRKGQITTPAQASVVNIEWQENNVYDRTAADDQLSGDPVIVSKGGSGSFEIISGALPADRYGQDMVMTVKDCVVTTGSEAETTRTYTFTKVTFNRGHSQPNDGQRGAGKVNFEFATVTET